MNDDHLERRAQHLARLYPRGWRERFGDEFEQLLIDEIRERRHSTRRAADVIAHALLAHLTTRGLAGDELAPRVQAWRSLRMLGVVAITFLALATGIWSQVAVGWAWATPAAHDTRVGMSIMAGSLLGLGVVFGLAALLVLWSGARSGGLRRRPLTVAAACGAALWAGCRHLAVQWPGAYAHAWAQRSVIPAGLARIGWAGTLWISAYWTHPGQLVTRPSEFLVWMIVCPLLLVTATAAGLMAVRRAHLSIDALRALTVLGAVGILLAGGFVAGAAAWILSSGAGPTRMFQPGAVDDVGLTLLACALVAAAHVTRRSLPVARRPSGA